MASAMEGEDESSTFALTQEVRVPKHLEAKFPEIKALAGLVECPVCYGALRDPLSTPCGHSFCSVCVRDYLTYKQQCPSCLKELHEKTLFSNKPLKTMTENLLKLVPKLEKVFRQEKIPTPT